MSTDAGLIGTIDKILTKTEGEIVSELDKTLYDAKSSIMNSKASMDDKYKDIIDGGKKEADKIEKQLVGAANLEARNRQIALVDDAISAVFEQAVEKLRSSKTDPAFLKSLIKEATETLGTTKVTVSANSKDTDAVTSALTDFEGSKLDPKPAECLGGIIARSDEKNMSFDNTIDARFDRIKPLIRKYVAVKFGLD